MPPQMNDPQPESPPSGGEEPSSSLPSQPIVGQDVLQPSQVIKPTLEAQPEPPRPLVTTEPVTAPPVPVEVLRPQAPQPLVPAPEPPAEPVAPPILPATPTEPVGTVALQPVLSADPTPPPTPAAVVTVHDVSGGTSTPFIPSTIPKKHHVPKKALLLVLIFLIIFGGGGAAAYVGYYVPNKPSNVLGAALENALQSQQAQFSGNLNVDSTDSNGLSVKTTFNGAIDTANKDADFQLNLTIAGITLPVEARLVDQNLYIKFGDLSSIATIVNGLIGVSDPTTSQAVDSVVSSISKELSNQWVSIDSTLLKQAGLTCALDANLAITTADINLLKAQYKQSQFLTIHDTSSATVNGQSTEKFDLSIDGTKLARFEKVVPELSPSKSLDSCDGNKTANNLQQLSTSDSTTPLTVWVNKKTKRIVQVSSQATAQDIQNDHIDGNLTLNLSYGTVSVAAPTGAKPFDTVIVELEQTLATNPNAASLFDQFTGGSSGSAASGISSLTQTL